MCLSIKSNWLLGAVSKKRGVTNSKTWLRYNGSPKEALLNLDLLSHYTCPSSYPVYLPAIYLLACLSSICLSACQRFACLSVIYLPVCLSSICLPACHLFACLPVIFPSCLSSTCLPVCHLFARLSVIYLPSCLSAICLPACHLFSCLPVLKILTFISTSVCCVSLWRRRSTLRWKARPQRSQEKGL
jgi:hypothetical protein